MRPLQVPLFVVGYLTQPDWSGKGGRETRGLVLPDFAARCRSTYAASSMAKIAVSG